MKLRNRFLSLIIVVAMAYSCPITALAAEERTPSIHNTQAEKSSVDNKGVMPLASGELTGIEIATGSQAEGWFYLSSSSYVWLMYQGNNGGLIYLTRVCCNGSYTPVGDEITFANGFSGGNSAQKILVSGGQFKAGWYHYELKFYSANGTKYYQFAASNTK